MKHLIPYLQDGRKAESCTRPLRIIPLPLKPAKMPRLTMPERGNIMVSHLFYYGV
jgi:hypothetical protein